MQKFHCVWLLKLALFFWNVWMLFSLKFATSIEAKILPSLGFPTT